MISYFSCISLRNCFFSLILVMMGIFGAMHLFSSSSTTSPLTGIPFAIAADARLQGNLSMFLKIDGISGISTDSRHRGEIVVDSYSVDVSRSLTASKPTFSPFTVTMLSSPSIAKLLMHTAGGVKIPRITLSVVEPGSKTDVIRWILTDATILSLKTVGNIHGDGVHDALSFSYGKLQVEYTPQDGSEIQRAGWDQRTGKSTGN